MSALLEFFDALHCDRETIAQDQLDLVDKFRYSLLPWRGQFSPELVEFFLSAYTDGNAIVLDPFVGSGTTLFEAARRGLECYATEINPSAVEMARTAHFVNVALCDRRGIILDAETVVGKYLRSVEIDLFNYQDHIGRRRTEPEVEVCGVIPLILRETVGQPLVRNLIINAFIRYMNRKPQEGSEGYLRAFREHSRLVTNLPYSERPCRVFHSDARDVPLPDGYADLVITSPPYINVFNYHQNNRPAMEVIGWDLLQVARSEVGSNRKNRQNRFLTVVQYALDMAEALKTIHRLLCAGGRAIIVVGRESNVRGVSFKNSKLIAALAIGVAGFSLCSRQERKFKNKFGEVIYEDILHLLPTTDATLPEVTATQIAKFVLTQALETAPRVVRGEILQALERADNVKQSPLFTAYKQIA